MDQRQAAVEAEWCLVARCLAGEESAWDELYRLYHPRVKKAIEFILGARGADVHLIEEVGARVWFALVRNQAQLLRKFDPERHSRLDSFLAGLARIEILRYARSEGRRRTHEATVGGRSSVQMTSTEGQLVATLDDFMTTLTPAEREFLEQVLIAPVEDFQTADGGGLSMANIWQRRHRIRSKLYGYFREP